MRGLHVRLGAGENKLVRCSAGSIFDVVVDLRPGSPTFMEWASFELSGDTQKSLYVPAGCAHGFRGAHRAGRHLLSDRPGPRPGLRPDHRARRSRARDLVATADHPDVPG
ncbi:dTDP-4-dehydrorhamnose 3,5-epimerase family protein [Nocardioides sp. B-3]|uniref:dTDP-4-dehydrorhamnose 3,5-epimerase family protein n=1 Tax=Nocardioides sp. B-3 TaxID=2895565 RepID=UPI002153362C|nr:dTDP-4-dehydrorhamnose 3,5-epimerase family protein [Nocardioides sp. B-3]UUZ60408.1 dTDP-4-dehydrorhamnose 3,5-epimerase family protein [Nocardioides sp. B-3]